MIIDAHAHIFPDKIAEKAVAGIGSFYSELTMKMDGTADMLIKSGDKNGIDKFIVQSVATVPAQTEGINNFIAASVEKYPDRFIGFAAIHPDNEDIAGEIDRAEKMGMRGVKIHPDFQLFNIDSDKAMAIYEAIEGRLPILIHMGDYRYEYSKPRRLARVMDMFPKLEVIGAHFGGWSEWEDAENLLAGRENLWVDTSSSLYAMSPKEAKARIDKFGADRVLFGTDYPMWDAEDELKRFMAIPLSDDEREMILCKNAERLLNI